MAKAFGKGGGGAGSGNAMSALFGGEVDPLARYEMVNSMLQGAMQPSAAASPWVQALAPIAGGFIGRRNEAKLGQARDAANRSAIETLAGLGVSAPVPTPGVTTSAVSGKDGEWGYAVPQDFVNNLVGMESGGNYQAVGPKTRHGRALGFSQILPGNVRAWSKEILGREVTPEEFLADEDLQRQITFGKLDQYWRQTGGNPRDVASLWHSGVPYDKAVAQGRRDVNMSTQDYANKVASGVGGGFDATSGHPTGGQRFSRDQMTGLLEVMNDRLVSDPLRDIASTMLTDAIQSGQIDYGDVLDRQIDEARRDYWRNRADAAGRPPTEQPTDDTDVMRAITYVEERIGEVMTDTGVSRAEAIAALQQDPVAARALRIAGISSSSPAPSGGNAAPRRPSAVPDDLQPGLPGGGWIQ